MNTGFFWSEDSLADLLAMDKGDFLIKYPKVSENSYRQRLASEQTLITEQTPITITGDGNMDVQEWCYKPRKPTVPLGLEKHVMIGDTHGVFVEQPVFKAVLDFIRDFKPHQINLLGDMIDFYEISRFDKDPMRRVVLGREIEFTRENILAEIRRAAPKARIVWLQGNHEHRLQRYLWSRAPELASLPGLDMRSLFDLGKLKIMYQEQNLEIGDTQMTHGHMARKHSAYTAKAMLDDYGQSVIHNHTHRLGAHYKTDRAGSYLAFENGCLCTFDMDYVNNPNWQHGFSVGWLLADDTMHFEQLQIKDNGFFYGGKFFGTEDELTDCHD